MSTYSLSSKTKIVGTCSENNKSKCTTPDKIKQDSGPLFTKRFDVLTQDLEAARFGPG